MKSKKKIPAALDRITPRRQVFCQAVARGLSGAQAALEAGYSKRSAADTASRLLKEPLIAGLVKQLREESWNSEALSLSEANAILGKLARSDLGNILTGGRIDPGKLAGNTLMLADYGEERNFDEEGNETVKRKVKLVDRIAAIRAAAQINGWNASKDGDSHDVGGVKITVNLASEPAVKSGRTEEHTEKAGLGNGNET